MDVETPGSAQGESLSRITIHRIGGSLKGAPSLWPCVLSASAGNTVCGSGDIETSQEVF